MIAGGQLAASTDPISAEIFDPRSGGHSSFSGDIPTGGGSGLLLPDGRVLITSFDLSRTSAGQRGIYLLDPDSMTARFVSLPAIPDTCDPNEQPAIARLQDGNVLLVSDGADTSVPSKAFVFDPITASLTEVGSLNVPRHLSLDHDVEGRSSSGGRWYLRDASPASPYYGVDGLLSDAELYDPATGQFSPAGTMPSVRGKAASFLLSDGRVLIQHAGDNSDAVWRVAPAGVTRRIRSRHRNVFRSSSQATGPAHLR